jgi:hypothetical protein
MARAHDRDDKEADEHGAEAGNVLAGLGENGDVLDDATTHGPSPPASDSHS